MSLDTRGIRGAHFPNVTKLSERGPTRHLMPLHASFSFHKKLLALYIYVFNNLFWYFVAVMLSKQNVSRLLFLHTIVKIISNSPIYFEQINRLIKVWKFTFLSIFTISGRPRYIIVSCELTNPMIHSMSCLFSLQEIIF